MNTVQIIQLVIAVYLLVMCTALNTKDMFSGLLFKTVPLIMGLGLVLISFGVI